MLRTLLTLSFALVLATSATAQTSYPMISHVHPVAVQRGKTTSVVVSGTQNFAHTYQALFEGAGLSAKVVSPKPDDKALTRAVTLSVTAAADTPLNVREFRLASRLGVSSVGQLVVSEHPVIEEKGDNNTRDKANPIAVPCVVAGKIEIAEDVDYFKFSARAGQTFSFEVFCARIQDKIHDLQKHADPIITLYDAASGRELASNDDYFFADSYLSYTFAKDGDYVVQVRDSKYDGDPRWVYALLVSDRPHVAHVYPSAVQAGKTTDVEAVGSAGQTAPKIALKAPEKPGVHELALETRAGKTNAVPVIVSSLPQAVEAEPNDTPDKATRVTLPCGINGRIGAPRDVDHFIFAAKKGQTIRFEVKARRFGTLLQSSLDSFLEVLNAKGAVLASNDDTNGKDPAITFTPTVDGDYLLRVRDLNSKGGPSFVYHIEADWAKPDFALKCDGDKAMIGPGSRMAWYVQLTRLNGFTGPVKIDVKGLPEGVSVNPLTIQAGQAQGLLVLSAAKEAKITAANVEVVGSATVTYQGKDEMISRPVEVIQEIYFPGGGRGLFPVNMQTVAITEPSDILEVKVSAGEIVLRPGGEIKLEVTVERKAGFTGPITLDVMLRHLGRVFGNTLPPGVTLVEGKSKTLLGAASKGYIVLKADATAAPIENVPISVLTNVSINFVVKVSYSSEAILLSVRK